MANISIDTHCHTLLQNQFQNIFDEEFITEICRSGHLKKFTAENTLMNIGDEMKYFPLILEGSLKILTEENDGRELLLYYLEAGDTCVIKLALDQSKKSRIRAIAEEFTQVLFIPVNKMDEWMVKHKHWRHFVMKTYSHRLNEMLGAIDTLAFHNMDDRLLKYLRDKAMKTGNNEIHNTHAQIANDLHSSRVVISRIMAKLEIDGQIKYGRNKIELLKF